MDSFFRQPHPPPGARHDPSPASTSSPHSTHSLGNAFASGYGGPSIERILQSSPSDLNFGRFGAGGSTADAYANHNQNAPRSGSVKDERRYDSQSKNYGLDFGNFGQPSNPGSSQTQSHGSQQQQPAAKRGSKACVACRKGKNRCEGDPSGQNGPCRRCLANNIQCVYEKASERKTRNGSVSTELTGEADGRVSQLERSVHSLAHGQSQIQNALQQILSMLPNANTTIPTPTSLNSYLSQADGAVPTSSIFPQNVTPPNIFNNTSPTIVNPTSSTFNRPQSPQNTARGRASSGAHQSKKDFPKLPGFAPPDHRFGTYGIIPLSSAPPSPSHSRRSSVSSSASANDSALPHSMTAPIQALQALANAADAISDDRQDGKTSDEGPARKKQKRVTIDGKAISLKLKKDKPDPTPKNPFPDVVTKGLVTESEARELWDVFFSGCHYFVPLWDKSYDTYETFVERTPFSTNGLLAVAAKIRAGNGPLGQTFHRCLEEAQGIARSTLFGPIVRKEAVMAMLILSVWSQNGWLPCGHALRMGLDMNLHRALDKLADTSEARSDADERELVVSARIWLNCYMHDHLVALGTAKPLMLRDDSSVKRARLLLSHPMMSETDGRLVASVELVNIRVRVVEHLNPLHGKVDSQTISFVKRIFSDLQDWYHEWYAIHRQRYDEDSVIVRLLEVELVHTQLWTICVALRGCQWDKLPREQRELAFQAKDAALRCMEIFLRCENFRRHLKYATHDQLVSAAFAAVFLLKVAILYPSEVILPVLISQVSELAHVLSSECFAERYALTLRLMLANFRKKAGVLSTVPGTPRYNQQQPGQTLPTVPTSELDTGLQSLLALPQMGMGDTTEGLGEWNLDIGMDGFAWPTEFSPSALPVWLQDGNFTDLGMPLEGTDSLFLPLETANLFLPSGTGNQSSGYMFNLPDSGDVGAEAW